MSRTEMIAKANEILMVEDYDGSSLAGVRADEWEDSELIEFLKEEDV